MTGVLKIVVFVPEEFAEEMMEGITSVVGPVNPGYDRTFSISKVIGTWRPLAGSNPFKGTVGKVEVADELKIEFIIRKEDLRKVISTVVEIHPYEEPGIDIIEMTDWHSLV